MIPLLAAALLLWGMAALAGPLPRYTVHRASTPIHLDGHLDEFAWESAEQIDGFERILNDYGEITRLTRAKMLWDQDNFYFAFACQDPDMWAIYRQEDASLWEEEVVEVFIDPNGDGKDYLELEVNPRNVKVDLRIRRLEPDWESSIPWDIAGLQTAVQTYGTVDDSLSQDQGWTAEIAIPWAAMADSITGGGRPKADDIWRLNLYRIERKAGRDLMLRIREMGKHLQPFTAQLDQILKEKGVSSMKDLPADLQKKVARIQKEMEPLEKELKSLQDHFHEQTEYTAWSATYQRGFHHPARFGVVEFGE